MWISQEGLGKPRIWIFILSFPKSPDEISGRFLKKLVSHDELGQTLCFNLTQCKGEEKSNCINGVLQK